jgi:hypothetical protein
MAAERIALILESNASNGEQMIEEMSSRLQPQAEDLGLLISFFNENSALVTVRDSWLNFQTSLMQRLWPRVPMACVLNVAISLLC